MYHCILQAARECVRIHMHRYPRVCMYVCMFTYINIHTLYPLVSLIHTRTRTICGKQRNILDLKKNKKPRTEKELAWKNVGSCKRARLHFPNFRKRDSSLARVYLTKRGTHIFSSAHITFARYHRRVSTFTHTHTLTYLRCDDSETVHVQTRDHARV